MHKGDMLRFARSKIALMVPTERERAYFADHGLRAHLCGVGMAECAAATAAVIVKERPELVVLAGIAGAYGEWPSVGETIVVESETVADLGRRERDGGFTPLFRKSYRAGFVFSGDGGEVGFDIVPGSTVNMAGGLVGGAVWESGEAGGPGVIPAQAAGSERFSAIENMEGAAFFAVCARLGVRAMEVRTISNRVGEAISPQGLEISTRRLAADLSLIFKAISH